MRTIIILSGISASGKSTWTRNKIQTCQNFISVSRDKIRELMFGYDESTVHNYYKSPNFKANEKLISVFQTTNIRQALSQGFDVIIDNTNLDKYFIEEIMKEFPQCDFEFVLIECDVEIAKLRDAQRLRKVGGDVIDKQFKQLQHLKTVFNFEKIYSKLVKYESNEFFPNAIICDLDGTIADYSATRPAYGFEASLIRLDKVIEPVRDIVWEYSNYGNIIFLSGRTDNYLAETYKWLGDNLGEDIPFTLFMRKSNDFRKDNIIKYEIFNEKIRNTYNVKFAIDDRNSITSLWQSLNIFTINVNQSVKEF